MWRERCNAVHWFNIWGFTWSGHFGSHRDSSCSRQLEQNQSKGEWIKDSFLTHNNNRSTHLFYQVLFWVIYTYFLQWSQEPYEEGNMFSPFYRWGNWGRGKLSNFLEVMKLVTAKDEWHTDNASLSQCCLNSSVMQPLGLNAAPYEWGKHQFLWGVSVCAVISCFSCVWLCATLWTIAHQAPLSLGVSR